MRPTLRTSADTPKRKILLVDDSDADAEFTRLRLEDSPVAAFDVRIATDLSGALELLSELSPDAIILDLNLPDSQGVDTVRRVKHAAGTVPIIVVSGVVDATLRNQAQEEGAEEVFDKSESSDRLFSRSVLYVLERVRAAREHEQLERVLETTPDALLIVDLSGLVQYANQSAARLFGRPRDEFVGRPLGLPITEKEEEELSLPGPDGERFCQTRSVSLDWEGRPCKLLAMRDVTAQKQLEAQLMMSERLASIGILAAGVGHEINNSLASVLTNLDLAKRFVASKGEQDGELLDELSDACEGAERVRLIARDLRVLARTNSETKEVVDVHDVIRSTLRMARNETRHRARVVLDFRTPLKAHANAARLGQVLLNLVVNAAQAIPEGDYDGNEIVIGTRLDSRGNAVISVRDTGIGMPKELQHRVFSPFFTTKPVGTGTGLGLAICQRIITTLGGTIRFESEVGVGTCFTVSLPSAPSATPSDAPAVKSPSVPPATGVRRGRVLIVDDEVMFVKALRRLLATDHDVVGVNDAREAFEMLSAGQRFDAILCDLMMPQTTGIDFYNLLSKLSPGEERKILFVTGGVFSREMREFIELVENPCLDKPIDGAYLKELIASRVAVGQSPSLAVSNDR